jgi:cation:H+ antiporter
MEWIQIIQWFVYLLGALYVLLKGSDLFVERSKKVGESIGISPFVTGVLFVAFGTSLPELATSVVAVFQGATTIVLANVVGSNITNILLIIGLLATIGGSMMVSKDLVKNGLPAFFISASLFLLLIFDGTVDVVDALLLLAVFGAYLWHLLVGSKHDDSFLAKETKPPFQFKELGLIFLGLAGVIVGAHFAVDMTVNIATAFAVPLTIISIIAIAMGTSLPELFVSIHAFKKGEIDLALGNIYGSNVFNILIVLGIPALIVPLVADEIIMQVGIPIMVVATIIAFVCGLMRKIKRWEGIAMLALFVFFLFKLTMFL